MNGLSGFNSYINLTEENPCQPTGEGFPFSRDIYWKENQTDDKTGYKEQITRFQNSKSIPLWYINNGEIRLLAKNPIQMNIYIEEDCFSVENESLNIYAVGFSLEEAIENFTDHVIEFWKHYKALPYNKAGKFAKKLKNKYLSSFIKG